MNELEEFKKKTEGLVYRHKAIFPSEAFLFYREAKRIDADHIIESGIGNGGSTAYLDKLFPEIKITSIDRGKVEQIRLDHPRIEFVQGDGVHKVPLAVYHSSGKSLAVLIDGPKGYQAIKLASSLLRNERVKIVAIHDLQADITSPIYLDNPVLRNRMIAFLGKAFANSHDAKFRDFAGWLDKEIVATKKHPNGPGLSIYRND